MKGKPVALVTGAGFGIGRSIAIELAQSGYDIAAVDIERIEELGVDFFPIQADISLLEDHKKIIELTLSKFERIDVLVNNAGIAPDKRLDILETTPESYDRVLSVNSRGAFFLTQRAARKMIDLVHKDPNCRPCIIFISSISADVSSPSRAEYCISKAALSQISRIFADRLSEFNINVYEVRPGIIQTRMTAAVKDKYDRQIAEGLIPQKRWGQPEDVARAVVSLAKGSFSYSTGMVVEVSGGMNIRRL
jgi:NAD(P)-dependent dehydrogenase (short-subunit alcohol dehydrogenase family)